jgi:PIN domain nuclease of toxin-antitoxin system
LKFLLDTHVFLWWITDDSRLSPKARELISNGQNELFFSAASAWEIAIKAQIGRLQLSNKPDVLIPDQLLKNSIEALPIHLRHALHVFDLPSHHRDPFDRMIIAQAKLEDLPIISSDKVFSQYSVEVVW